MECGCKRKLRDEDERKRLNNRLNRIEGQIRGIRKMVDGDAYCIDILTQLSAVTSALNSFGKELLSSHIKTCVSEDIKAGGAEKTDELIAILERMI